MSGVVKIKRKIIAVALAVALAASMGSLALASSPSPAGIDLSPSTTPPEIRPDTDPNFPGTVAGLSNGLCFGIIDIMDVNEATANIVRSSAVDHHDSDGREIGLRVRSGVDFDVQVNLTGFQVSGANTISGAFKVFTQDSGTPIIANTAAGEVTNANNEWRTMSASPAVVTADLGLTNPLMSGSGGTPGATATFVRGRNLAGVEILWATNLVAELHMIPGTATAIGQATATMTWTAVPAL